MAKPTDNTPKPPGIFSLLKPYSGLVTMLVLFALFSNSVTLWLPKIIRKGIDGYIHSLITHGHFDMNPTLVQFSLAVLFIFIFAFLQTIIQTYTSERVARDLRTKLSDKISRQSNGFIDKVTPAKLLTNLTADVDSKAVCFAGVGFNSFISNYYSRGQHLFAHYRLEACALHYCDNPHYWRHLFLGAEKSTGAVY